MDVEEEEEDGEHGRRMQKEARVTADRSAKATYLRGNGGSKALSTTMRKEKMKKIDAAAANTVATVPAAAGVFKCAQCPPDKVAFSSLEQLGKHQQRQHGDRQRYRHQCQQCGQSFPYDSNLQVHMRVHTGEKPFTCQECGRGFSLQSHLTVHERVHTGERPYICRVCKKAFAAPNNLHRHSRVHSGETPFSCQHCARQFNQSSACRRHEKFCSSIRVSRPAASE